MQAELQLSDMEHHAYGTYLRAIGSTPSATEHRVMVRILAFALHATNF